MDDTTVWRFCDEIQRLIPVFSEGCKARVKPYFLRPNKLSLCDRYNSIKLSGLHHLLNVWSANPLGQPFRGSLVRSGFTKRISVGGSAGKTCATIGTRKNRRPSHSVNSLSVLCRQALTKKPGLQVFWTKRPLLYLKSTAPFT